MIVLQCMPANTAVTSLLIMDNAVSIIQSCQYRVEVAGKRTKAPGLLYVVPASWLFFSLVDLAPR